MADKLVTVMTFNQSFEAQLAKNLLENEGIVSVVTGEFSSDILLGTVLGRNQIALQVHEEDAQRAVALLAEVELNKDWEDEAESGTDVWICSICGEPISNNLSICYACQTPRDGIRASAQRDSISSREERISPPRNEPEA
jgi:rubrerythrin